MLAGEGAESFAEQDFLQPLAPDDQPIRTLDASPARRDELLGDGGFSGARKAAEYDKHCLSLDVG